MSNACVTAVIPLHNHEKWIGSAIRSVMEQDHPNKNIVVVDDGSTDGSLNIVKSAGNWQEAKAKGMVGNPKIFAGKIDDIHILLASFQEGHGPSFARNRGIELALSIYKPDYVALLDSDDMYEQGKISKSVAIFEASGSKGVVGAVYSDYDTLRPDGLRVREYKEPFSRQRILQDCIVNCDSIVSAQALKATGPFDEELRVCEDYDFWLRLSDRFLISHIPESLVTIRVGEHSSTSSVPSETWQRSWRRVMEKTQARMARPNG